MNSNNRRIEWIDYYKTIVIIFMIIGHITGKYNIYIYQFHMAAFFFISGYCMNFNKSSWKMLWEKLYSLILPLIVVFCFGAISMAILNFSGYYSEIWGDYSYIGFKEMFIQFFRYNSNYVWWMGACWFIQVLFGINILVIFLSKIFNYVKQFRNILFVLCSVLIYVFGISMAKNGGNIYNIDLICIGQLYVVLGIILKQYKFEQKFGEKWIKLTSILSITSGLLYLGGKIQNITVDYPSRNFCYYFLSVLFAINGVIWVYCITKILTKILQKSKYIKKGLMIIGQNTLAIVYFHFLFIKVGFLILVLFNIVDVDYIKNFIPQEPIGSKYLLLFLFVCIAGSIVFWKLLMKFKFSRILLGQDKEFRDNFFNMLSLKFKDIKINSKDMHGSKKNTLIDYTWKELVKENNLLIKSLIVLSLIIFIPFIMQGIILNDEIKLRLYRMPGISNLINAGINIEFNMGRPLRFMAGINETFSFITENMYINKIIQILIILLCIILFVIFLDKVFHNKQMSLITGILIILFLPITFEHAVPNAFVGLTVLPIVYLLISFIFWCNYLETEKYSNLWISIILWIISLFGYEFMVTYTPVFLILYLVKREQKSLKDFIKVCIIPCGIGFIYLVSMFAIQYLSSDKYSGVTVSFVSLESSIEIIINLIKSAIPGYFFTNGKYRYLLYMFSREKYPIILEKNLDVFTKTEFWNFVLTEFLTPRVVIVLLMSIFVLVYIFKKIQKTKITFKGFLLSLIIMILYLAIPVLPNSISQLYQGNVTENNFTSLPVSFSITLVICMIIAYVVSFLINIVKDKSLVIVIFVGIVTMITIPVQGMNEIISMEQKKNYERLLEIEDLFETECISSMNNSYVYSEDIFSTYNALSIHTSYWDDYFATHKLNIKMNSADNSDFEIYYVDDSYFSIVGKYEIVVLSKEKLQDTVKLEVSQNNYVVAFVGSYYVDNDFYCYRFNKYNNYSAIEDSSKAFDGTYKIVGDSLQTANIIDGFYPDGWIKQKAIIEISSGSSGKMELQGYYPYDIPDGSYVQINVDNEQIVNYIVKENLFSLQFQLEPEKSYIVEIITNLNVVPDNGDIRELGFILKDLYSVEEVEELQ